MKKYMLLLVIILNINFLVNAQIKIKRPINKTINPITGQKLFLKIDGIDGSSKEVGHKKWIDIESFYFDTKIKNNGRGKVMELSFSKFPDISSVDLAMHANNNRHIPKVELEITQTIKGKQVLLFKYELSNTQVKLYTAQVNSSKEQITENLIFIADSVTIVYYNYDSDGKFISSIDRLLKSR